MIAEEAYAELAELIRSVGTLHRRARNSWEANVWKLGRYRLFQTTCGRESWIKRDQALHVYLRQGSQPRFHKGTVRSLKSGLSDMQSRPLLAIRPVRRRSG